VGTLAENATPVTDQLPNPFFCTARLLAGRIGLDTSSFVFLSV